MTVWNSNIAIFNSSIYEFAYFKEWSEPIFGREIVALEAIATAFPKIHFHVRIHPNLAGKENSQIRALKKFEKQGWPNLHFIWSEEKIDSYALVLACEKTIVFGSTVGVEACYLGKPSILIGRAFYEDVGCCYHPKSREELFEYIEKKLQPKDRTAALKYGNWEKTRGELFEHYKPKDLFSGEFMGQEIKPKLNRREKVLYKLFRRVEVTKNSIRKRVGKKA